MYHHGALLGCSFAVQELESFDRLWMKAQAHRYFSCFENDEALEFQKVINLCQTLGIHPQLDDLIHRKQRLIEYCRQRRDEEPFRAMLLDLTTSVLQGNTFTKPAEKLILYRLQAHFEGVRCNDWGEQTTFSELASLINVVHYSGEPTRAMRLFWQCIGRLQRPDENEDTSTFTQEADILYEICRSSVERNKLIEIVGGSLIDHPEFSRSIEVTKEFHLWMRRMYIMHEAREAFDRSGEIATKVHNIVCSKEYARAPSTIDWDPLDDFEFWSLVRLWCCTRGTKRAFQEACTDTLRASDNLKQVTRRSRFPDSTCDWLEMMDTFYQVMDKKETLGSIGFFSVDEAYIFLDYKRMSFAKNIVPYSCCEIEKRAVFGRELEVRWHNDERA